MRIVFREAGFDSPQTVDDATCFFPLTGVEHLTCDGLGRIEWRLCSCLFGMIHLADEDGMKRYFCWPGLSACFAKVTHVEEKPVRPGDLVCQMCTSLLIGFS